MESEGNVEGDVGGHVVRKLPESHVTSEVVVTSKLVLGLGLHVERHLVDLLELHLLAGAGGEVLGHPRLVQLDPVDEPGGLVDLVMSLLVVVLHSCDRNSVEPGSTGETSLVIEEPVDLESILSSEVGMEPLLLQLVVSCPDVVQLQYD